MHFESGPGSHPKIFQGLPRTSRDVQQQALITELSVLLFSANDYWPPSAATGSLGVFLGVSDSFDMHTPTRQSKMQGTRTWARIWGWIRVWDRTRDAPTLLLFLFAHGPRVSSRGTFSRQLARTERQDRTLTFI